MSKYKAISYTRLSYTNEKDNESNSISNQKALIRDFVKRHSDIEIISEKVDDGYTGVLFDRPAFQEMMEDIRAEKVNCIIVKDLSRFGRDYIQTGKYLRQILPSLGVRFIAINDNIDTLKENCTGLDVSLKTIINDAYSQDISKKIRSVLEQKRKEGLYVASFTPYGYQKATENKNQLVIDEKVAPVVKDIFKMKLDGMSASKIADVLNEKGILSPVMYKKQNGYAYAKGGYITENNAKWSATTILRILKNEIYTGTMVQGKKTTYNYKLKNIIKKPKSEWVYVENTHEAIVSKQEFDLVQNILFLDTRTAPFQENVYLFSGLLICADCGSRMTRKTVTYKNKKYFYYYCPTGKKGCTSSHMIKEDELIACVLESIKKHISSVISLEKLLQNIESTRINQKIVQKYGKEIAEKEQMAEELKVFQSSLYENYIKGILPKLDYRMLKQEYTVKLEMIEKEISALNEKREKELWHNRKEWIEHFKKFSNITELDRNAVIQLVQSVKIFEKKQIEITFRYQSEYEETIKMFHSQKEVI